MTPTSTPTSDTQAKVVLPRRPRRISPDFAEVLQMLAAFDARPDAGKTPSDKT
jgi:hypothetical protein